MRSFFVWNGIDCRSKGVFLSGPPSILRGEERVQHITIPGMAGELTQTEGDDIYNSYIQTLTLNVRGGARVREILAWLRGTGYVTFSSEPDRRQKARVIGAVTLDRHSVNMDIYSGEVQFYCEPFKERLSEQPVTVSSSGVTVYNGGDVKSKPKITATASSTTVSVSAGGNTLTIAGVTSGNAYVIDCKTEIITNSTGTENVTSKSSGKFPVLDPGDNAVTGSGWSSLEIDRRERFL